MFHLTQKSCGQSNQNIAQEANGTISLALLLGVCAKLIAWSDQNVNQFASLVSLNDI